MFVYMVGSSIADFHSCIYTLTQQQIGSECQIFSPKLLRKVHRCTLRHSSLLFGRKSKLRQGSFVDKCILCASATWASLAIKRASANLASASTKDLWEEAVRAWELWVLMQS